LEYSAEEGKKKIGIIRQDSEVRIKKQKCHCERPWGARQSQYPLYNISKRDEPHETKYEK